MPRISTLILPQEDEFFYSYLYRLSVINSTTIQDLLGRSEEGLKKHKTNDRTFRYDSIQPLSKLFSQLSNIHTPEISEVDPVELYLSHSLYDVRAPFLNEVQQYDEINRVFNPEYHDMNSRHTLDLVPTIKLCPECAKKDEETLGFRMIRKSHQLPNITYCRKHNCTLLSFCGKKGEEFDPNAPFSPTQYVFSEQLDKKYADFITEIANARLDCNLAEVGRAIAKRAADLGIKKDKKTIQSYLKKFKYLSIDQALIDQIIKVLRWFSGNALRRINIEVITTIIFLLFEEKETFVKYLEIDNLQTKFTQLSSEYKCISSYRKTILFVEHVCGYRFVTTTQALLDGYDCAKCHDFSDATQSFQYLLDKQHNYEYSVLSPFSGMYSNVIVRHNPCNKKITTTPYKIMKCKTGCNCVHLQNRTNHMRNQIETHTQFKLIRYIDYKSFTLECPVCGGTFNTSTKLQYNDYKCPFCQKNEGIISLNAYEDTTDYFREKVKALVDDEYEVLDSSINTAESAEIKHNTCQTVFKTRISNFLAGQRCPNCSTSKMSRDETSKYVETVTKGKYTVLSVDDLSTSL